MIDIEKLKQAAIAVKGWGNCNQAWLDTSEDTSAAVVGSIDEDGNSCQVITVDCDQYYQGQDSLPLAKYYAQANPSAILELINRMEAAESQPAAQELVIQQLRDHIADSADTAAIALRKAWQLGQTYWQQADSESYSQQDKSVGTQERFSKLVSDTCVEINQALAIPHSTEHLEAWYKEMVGVVVGWRHSGGAMESYWNDAMGIEWAPLHAIKPFKGE